MGGWAGSARACSPRPLRAGKHRSPACSRAGETKTSVPREGPTHFDPSGGTRERRGDSADSSPLEHDLSLRFWGKDGLFPAGARCAGRLVRGVRGRRLLRACELRAHRVAVCTSEQVDQSPRSPNTLPFTGLAEDTGHMSPDSSVGRASDF